MLNVTFILPPLRLSLNLSRPSTCRLISRWRRRPKSLNIVEPPDKTILWYKGLRTSIGQFCITLSTISEIGVTKSGLANSGWKKISGPINRSYPTSTEKGCFVWRKTMKKCKCDQNYFVILIRRCFFCTYNGINALIFFHPLCWITIILCKFLCNVRTNVAVSLFYRLCCFQWLFRGN